MSNNNRSYLPEYVFINSDDDVKKNQGQMPSVIETPPPSKPVK